MKKNLVLFDFDGTLTTKNSLIEFIKFYRGSIFFYLSIPALFLPVSLFKVKLIPAQKLKEHFFTFFFQGENEFYFKKKAIFFSLHIIPRMINRNALKKIEEYKKNNDRIVVVTASMTEWIEPWCNMLGIEHITTGLEYKNHVITGKMNGLNCNKEEKIRRIKEKINLNEYSTIIAYGNSKGDAAMLELADYKYYKFF